MNRIGKPTIKIIIDGHFFWLVPYHIDNKGDIAYLLKPVKPKGG